MNIEYLENATSIGEAFMKHFVLTWESFQIKHKDWIAEIKIDKQWYDQSYMWDKMESTSPDVSMKEALDYLRGHSGTVLFMTEKSEDGKNECSTGTKTIDFIAKTDSHQLADRIEFEWYESCRLFEQNMYILDALPLDLYVFDSSMSWCVVFTHETADLEAEEADNWLKFAQSRYCIICNK